MGCSLPVSTGMARSAWSPDSRRLFLQHKGWIERIDLRTGDKDRLAPGRAPAVSPDGRRVAFIQPGGRLAVVLAGGGQVQRVGRLRAAGVDWQPRVSGPPRCNPPAGAEAIDRQGPTTVLETTNVDGEIAYLACRRSSGVLRRITTGFDDAYQQEIATRFGSYGAYVAVAKLLNFDHYSTSPVHYSVEIFDVRRGRRVFNTEAGSFGGRGLAVRPFTVGFRIRTLRAGPHASAAWLTRTDTSDDFQCSSGATSAPVTQTYAIVAHDRTGTRQLDSVVQSGEAPPLADLRVTGGQVTWTHERQPRSAELE